MSDLDELADFAPTKKKQATYTPREERIIAGFEDIERFCEEHARLRVVFDNGTESNMLMPSLQRSLYVWSRSLMVHYPCRNGRMLYGTDFTRERPHDRGSPSSNTT